MRISLSRKIFWLFLPMTTISLLFGVTVYYGLTGINLANSQISQIKAFQLQLKELEVWQTNIIRHHDASHHKAFKLEINKTRKMATELARIQGNLPRYLRSRLEKISFFMDNFSRASLELYNRYDTDLRFPKKNGTLLNKLDARVDGMTETVDPQLLNSFRNELQKLSFLQLKIYHDRDISKLPELKKIKREMARIMNRPEILTIVDQFLANLEANYLNYLGIRDKEDFLHKTSERFFQVSLDTILPIEKRNQRTKHIFILAIIGITLLAILLNLLCWLYSSRYLRRFLSSHKRAIQVIEKSDYDFDLTRLPNDEIGDLTRTLKQVVSDRQQAEESLRKSEDRYRIFVDNATDAFYLSDMNGRFLDVNKAACTTLGYTREELLSLTIFDVDADFPPDKLSEILGSLTYNEPRLVESVHKKKDGKMFPVEVRIRSFGQKEQPLLLSLARDIADRKKAEQELTKHREHLEELVEKRTNELKEKTDKIEESRKALTYLVEDVNKAGEELRKVNMEYAAANKELKEFAYIVSHDLKAPLRAISQLTHWISEDYSEAFDDDGKKQMDLILKRVKRMDGLIEGILRYSRIGRIREKEERPDLNLIVKNIIDALSPPDNVKIIIENELPDVLRDSTRMEQVFQNLIGNAIKFMDKSEGIIRVGCADEGAYWKFSISDNGPGIDKRYHDKIFRIFQTLVPRDEHESTGIGLTLVKKIIELYGGSVSVESEAGRGATFFFTLPKKGEKYEKL